MVWWVVGVGWGGGVGRVLALFWPGLDTDSDRGVSSTAQARTVEEDATHRPLSQDAPG